MKITSPFNALLGALLFLLLTSCLTSAQTGSAQPAGTNSGTPVQASYESSHPISKIKPELREKFLRLHSELNSLKAEVDETNTYINQKSDDIVQAININISALTILIATLTLVFIAVPVFLIWQVPKHVKNVMGKHLTTMETDLLKSVDSKMINLENSYAKDISNRMYSAWEKHKG